MASNPALGALSGALAEIYSDEASIRRLARDSGLSLRQIAFDARPINTWSSVLIEAEFQGKIDRLIEVAQKEYPAAPDLLAAVAAYRAGRVPAPTSPSAPAPRPVPPSATPYRPTEAPYRPTDDEKRALAQALLQCDAMSSRSAREAVVGCLPAQIRQRVKYGPNDLIDVVNIVMAAANFPDGLRQLIDCVRQFEGGTYAMADVERLVGPFV